MKQFILTVLCVACMGFVGCSRGVPEDNSISDNNDFVNLLILVKMPIVSED